jgi:uncharacterized membrane protein (DUF485 family)
MLKKGVQKNKKTLKNTLFQKITMKDIKRAFISTIIAVITYFGLLLTLFSVGYPGIPLDLSTRFAFVLGVILLVFSAYFILREKEWLS